MKKLFTLGLTLLMAVGSYAQDDVRRLWDFQGEGFSQETLDNLAADAASSNGYWTNNETWFESKARTAGPLTAIVNGSEWVIPETEGLTIGAQSAKHFNIVFDHADGPHIWLNGKRTEDYIVIPQVPAGDTVTVVYASHSGSEARGFKISTDGFAGYYDGQTQWTTVGGKATVVIKNNNEDPTDLKLTTTNGMHFYYICVGERPKDANVAKKIGYIYDSTNEKYVNGGEGTGDGSLDICLDLLKGSLYCEVVNIDASTDVSAVTADSLEGFDVVVLSPYVNAGAPILQTVKQAIAFTPVLNLSPEYYTEWGYGSAVSSTSNKLQVKGQALESQLYKPLDAASEPFLQADGTVSFLFEGNGTVTGYNAPAGSYFAADSVLAYTMNGAPAIHTHTMTRNAYMLLPCTDPTAFDQAAGDIVVNAIMMLADTKAEVTQAARPNISQEYHHCFTTVTLTCPLDGAQMYYTTDGSEPTTASTLYTGPFDIKAEGTTVKAVAIGEGYLLSDVREQAIDIFELTEQPTITMEQADGQTTVTITPANEGDVIYYNYRGSNDPKQSATYTQPLVLTKHADVTAFTAANEAEGLLQSELVTAHVPVKGETVRIDVVSHMDANSGDYRINCDSKGYYTKGYNYYTDEILEQIGDSLVFAPADILTCVNPGTGWEIKTYGQPILHQNNDALHNVLDFNNYNPQTAEDDIDNEITKGCISYQGVTGTNPYNGEPDPATACIQSTEAFQAPFDVVVYASGYNLKAGVYVTADTLSGEWTKLGDLLANDIQGTADNGKDGKDRIWKRTLLSYEGTDKVFVKVASHGGKANIFDIFIKNAGPLSGEYVGIEDITAGGAAAGKPVRTEVYSIGGARLAAPAKGVNIVKEVYADGSVKSRKVVVK